MTHRCSRWLLLIPFVKMAMLVGLLIEFVFWYTPSMRKQQAYRERMESVFATGQQCADQAFAAKQYYKVGPCYAEWDMWVERISPPDSGFDWPWATWKETGGNHDRD